jgi:hypothetical protein
MTAATVAALAALAAGPAPALAPNVDLNAALTAAVGITAGCEAMLAHAKANETAIRKQIKIAASAPKPAPAAEQGPPGPAADLAFLVDGKAYSDSFAAQLLGVSLKTVGRRLKPAIKGRNGRNHRTGAQIKAYARERAERPERRGRPANNPLKEIETPTLPG